MRADIVILFAAALLLVYAVYGTVQKVRGKSKSGCCGTAEVVTPKKVEDTDEANYPYHYRLSVAGMHCSNCAGRVENTLDEMDGVWARVNLGKGEADVLTKVAYEEADFADVLKKTDYRLTACETL